MALARFLQISDLHLGRPFAWLPPERRELRRRDQHQALEHIIKHAIERDVHAILVPGDLFDGVPVDTGSLTFAVRAFSVPGCPPVFVAPGNHDPASTDNAAWNTRLQQARGTHWPSHVHVFDSPRWSAVPLSTLPGVRIWGRAFLTSSGTMDRPLAKSALEGVVTTEPGKLDVALFHGSREGRCPPAQKITAPFSDAEVTASPFVYHAVGHYHQRSEIEQRPGAGTPSHGVRLAYAGSPVALDYTEPGDHGALEVLARFDDHQCVVGVESIKLDRRRVLSTQADVTGCASPEQVDRRILHAYAAAGVSEHDFVKLTVIGRLMPGVRWLSPGRDVFARSFNVRWDRSAVRPDHDLDVLRKSEGRTTEERFALEMLRQIDAEEDAEQRVVLQRALYYGLDAFRVREVLPQWEEVEVSE
jgi:DNA repair exonuclease SbcCD nuclease subunit